MKKALKVIGIAILTIIIFRGFIFRVLIQYKAIGTRPLIEIHDKKLIQKINSQSINRQIDLEAIAEIADKITTEELKFTTAHASNDPNELIQTKYANCVGYAAMFNSIANYLIQERKLTKEIQATHQIGQLECLGVNLHQYVTRSFFKDHDFNTLKNINKNTEISLDPSISDYLWIERIVKKSGKKSS